MSLKYLRSNENDVWKSAVVRGAVVLVALFVIYLRIPYYFTHSLIIGEDGVLWLQAYIFGLNTLLFSFVGYLVSATRVIALLTQVFPVEYFPMIFFYSGIAVDLLVIWLLTSPRLDLPYRPLVALAVVCTAQGSHIIGGSMSHIQWVMPLGAFALMFMKPSGRTSILVAEAAFVGVSALTGPFALFLAPLFPIQIFLLRKDPAAARRMAILTATHWVGTLCQILSIAFNIDHALQPDLRPKFHWTEKSDWGLLINFSFQYFFMPVGSWIFNGSRSGAVIGIVLLVIAVPLVAMFLVRFGRYRFQQLFMLVFSALVVLAGIIKVAPQERYFYISGVLVFWFVCCIVAQISDIRVRYVGVVIIAAFQLFFVAYYRDFYVVKGEPDWPRWSKFVHSGLPLTVQILPPTWFINIPADPAGPMFYLNNWVGRGLGSLAAISGVCPGSINSVSGLDENYYVYKRSNINSYEGVIPRWVAKGEIGSSEGDIIAITDLNDDVLGFGFTGFQTLGGNSSEWKAVFPAKEAKIKVFAMSYDDRRACEIAQTN